MENSEVRLDKIEILGLRAACILGIHPDEREQTQDVVVDIVLFADLKKPGWSDDIADTVDYQEIEERARSIVTASRHALVEALAESLARGCLAEQAVQRVTVRVEKPLAPVVAKTITVEITRERKDYE